MTNKEIKKLTQAQREVLEALRDGGTITIDRYNMPWLGDRMLQPITRYFLTDNGLIKRLDKSRPAEAKGNGFVISEKGLSILADQTLRNKPKSKSSGNDRKVQDQPILPTERQLSFAKDLGIDVPSDATLGEVSDLISACLEKDIPASDTHRSIATLYGVCYPRFTGKRQLFERIFNAVSRPTHETDLASWFAYRVYRHLVLGAEDVLIRSPDHQLIKEIATKLVSDESALRSIRRYSAYDLLWFGKWTAPDGTLHTGGSKRTGAYQKTAALFHAKLGIRE